jgi:biopolymer transport protein ExbD
MSKDKHKAKAEDADLDLMPVMNLFSILIPFLLSVAVFQKLAIVEVNMPERSEMNMDQPPPEPDDQSLSLTVAITDDAFQIWARGGSLPAVFAKEFITYRCKGEEESFRVMSSDYVSKPVKCIGGQEATIYDREEIHMYSLARTSKDDPGTLLKAVYNSNDSAIVDGNMNFVLSKSELKPGVKISTLGENSSRTLDAEQFEKTKGDYRSAYDELAKTLINLHNKFIDMPDADNIIILADDKIYFDKVIQTMDVARGAGFWNIQLAKLGG